MCHPGCAVLCSSQFLKRTALHALSPSLPWQPPALQALPGAERQQPQVSIAATSAQPCTQPDPARQIDSAVPANQAEHQTQASKHLKRDECARCADQCVEKRCRCQELHQPVWLRHGWRKIAKKREVLACESDQEHGAHEHAGVGELVCGACLKAVPEACCEAVAPERQSRCVLSGGHSSSLRPIISLFSDERALALGTVPVMKGTRTPGPGSPVLALMSAN